MSNATAAESLTRLQNHKCKVAPGQPLEFTDACVKGDTIAQGDLILVLVDKVPDGFTKRTSGNNQLVPGNTVGSKHCIENLSTCTVFDPPGWTHDASYESYVGPVIEATGKTKIPHPVHGDVTVQAGQTIQCVYQRAWDVEQARERRQRD